MSNQLNPRPFKSKNRNKVVRYASLYCLHLAELYIQGCLAGKSDNLNEFIQWMDEKMTSAKQEIEKRTNWDVRFKNNDIYKLQGKMADLRRGEAVIGLVGINRYIKSFVRLFWDASDHSNSLKKFTTEFIPKITKQVAERKY